VNGNGRYQMSAGSNTDMVIAYVFRGVSVVIQGILVLMAWALFNLAVSIRDDTRDIKKEWPEMKKDIGELKEQGKTFATKTQLEAAEMRVKQEFQEQLRKGKIITNQNRQP
jgi:hypothetical protein